MGQFSAQIHRWTTRRWSMPPSWRQRAPGADPPQAGAGRACALPLLRATPSRILLTADAERSGPRSGRPAGIDLVARLGRHGIAAQVEASAQRPCHATGVFARRPRRQARSRPPRARALGPAVAIRDPLRPWERTPDGSGPMPDPVGEAQPGGGTCADPRRRGPARARRRVQPRRLKEADPFPRQT